MARAIGVHARLAVPWIRIALFLAAGGEAPTRVLAETYGLSMRTTQRCLEAIDLYVFPLEKKRGRWRRA